MTSKRKIIKATKAAAAKVLDAKDKDKNPGSPSP
jgi:hypothetical protein